MLANSEKRSPDGASQSKHISRSGSRVKKGTLLPPLSPEPPPLSVPRPLFSLPPLPSDRPLSVMDLPRLIAQVGPQRARGDTKWSEGPRMMASALGADIPIRTPDESTAHSLTEKAESTKVPTCRGKKIKAVKNEKPAPDPLSGTEVFQMFTERRGRRELELFYLKEVEGDSYRPYDLRVVPCSAAGSEHYIFSPHSVLHVTQRGYGGLLSLSEWFRESVLWRDLQEIPFFRDFPLRRAFTRWRRNVHKVIFQRRCKDLQDVLLIAVPQFRNALLLFNRTIEEVKGTHWLPQEENTSFTLLEFKDVLMTMNQECLQILEKLSQYRAAILNKVKEHSYRTQQELQLHLEFSLKPSRSVEPLHRQLLHQQQLLSQLSRSESVLQRLGSFSALINTITVQSIISLITQDLTQFTSRVLKRGELEGCLFHTELSLRDDQLTVDPPTHLLQEAVSGAILTVKDSVIQMCDSCGLFLEISNTSDVSQDSPSDLTCIEHHITGEDTSGEECCSWRLHREASSRWLQLQKRTSLLLQGRRLHGCFSPLTQSQLQQQIHIHILTTQAEEEQAGVMQEADLEIQQLCESFSWLVDIHVFISERSVSSLDSLKDQPASQYQDLIEKTRCLTERLSSVPSSVSTSNQLINIQCSRIKEPLQQQLRLLEEKLQQQLVQQIQILSENVSSDLQRYAARLRTEPGDLQELSTYALMMRECVKMCPDMQRRLEYIHSLQETLCKNYRKMTEQEETVKEKMLALWDGFIPLLKEADIIVSCRLPSMANALDAMFSVLACDLKNTVSKATAGPFIDPSQEAKEMVSRLSLMCVHVQNLNANLEQLSSKSQNLHEHPKDLSILTADVQRVKARKELWEIISAYTTWREEWKQLLLTEVVVSEAQGKVAKWKERTLSLTSIIPTHDAVLQQALGNLESLEYHVEVMAKLQSPMLTHRHWKDIFEGMGLRFVPEKKVIVAELTSLPLEVHQELINKICRDAQAEYNMEQNFIKLQQEWKPRLFQLDKFTLPVWQHQKPQYVLPETKKPTEGIVSKLQTANQHTCNDPRLLVIGLEIHFAEIENDLMTLSTMLKSPHSVDFRLQNEHLFQSLHDLGKLLCLFERYQQLWAFLTKMFHETSIRVQSVELLEQFQPIDETFKDIIQSVSSDTHVWNFVNPKKTNERFYGRNFHQILIDGVSTMEAISSQMSDLLESLCQQFPRLWFLSDWERIQLLSFDPTPCTLQPFVRKCFKGIRWLEVDCVIPSNQTGVKICGATSESQMKVLGFFGSLQEHITFPSPLEPNPNALGWLSIFEKELTLTMVQLMKKCAIVRIQLEPHTEDVAFDKEVKDIVFQIAERRKVALPVLDLVSEYPLQCLLVVEEAVWCQSVLQAFQESSPVMLRNIKAYNSAKWKTLGRFIRDGVTGSNCESLVSKYRMMCLRALVQLTMKHSQQLSRLMEVQSLPESSFEWLSFMKYHINSEDCSLTDDPTCHVDVLGHRLQYDYEYFGPEDCVMGHTPSTDRAILGILLALTSYRCGFVRGPCMSGKKTTVVQLGKALGRMVVNLQCCPTMSPGVVQRMLLGALQTGAWLLLDSVDLLTQGLLSMLGQHLFDIQQSFAEFTQKKNQRLREEPKDWNADGVTDCTNLHSDCHMVIAGKSISARPSYGCVVISSKGYSSEVPEILRCATRPIALTLPDYRIIAEVMLTSIGYSDAVSLSQRLVDLISLAQDSLCLPDSINDHQSCYLVLLQKIISASEMHFQQSERQKDISDEADPTPSETLTVRVDDKDRKEAEKPSRFLSSHLSIIQGLMEETAIVKAILSVSLPVLYEQKKALQFSILLKETFPIACQFPLFQEYIEEEEKTQLKYALTEELQRKCFHADTEIISSSLRLYHTMKLSPAVILIGPSGSGKTTCRCALAEALNHLAALTENDNRMEGDTPQISTWNSVDTVVLFPNAMSHKELFGSFCEKRGWQDGAVVKVLRDSEPKICNKNQKSDQIHKWLVMDGNPVGWLDYLTTMCSPQDQFLCLSSGEILPSQPHLRLVMEVTDLRDASPSAVTRCSLVYFSGSDLWKAVWRSEMDALSSEHKLDQGTLNMWNRLAEDLFSNTLTALTSAILNEGESLESVVHGMREIMSFVRILRALLQHVGKEGEKAGATPQVYKKDTPLHRAGTDSKGLLNRNLFLVAYIWGFSGHLHPRHWPRFDSVAHQVLFTCRYRIVVPDGESVFEYFFNIDIKTCSKNTLLTKSIPPMYRKYASLLNIMLEANQPVLLSGEPGSGKTTLCRTLLSFEKPHITLPASPLLRSRDLHTVLKTINCTKNCRDTQGPNAKQTGLLVFVDDLHEAPRDVFGKMSTALDTLRQSISMGRILTFDGYNFKLLSAASLSYMATCCVSGSHSTVISSRLSRLFSNFVLPSLSMDVILSIHSPRLKMWLKETQLTQSAEDMACCIITATKNVYDAVCDQFKPTVQRPLFIFSHHDLQKVFKGLCLWQPDRGTMQQKEETILILPESEPVLNIAHLWMHECLRTFSDRLCSEDESKTLESLIAMTATTHYGSRLADATSPVSLDVKRLDIHTLPSDTEGQPIAKSLGNRNLPQETKPAGQSDLKKAQTLTEPSSLSGNISSVEESLKTHAMQPQILQHMEDKLANLVYAPDLSEAPMNQKHIFKCSFTYQDRDLEVLLQQLRVLISRNKEDKGQEADYNILNRCVVHRQRVGQLLHILRALLIPGGHGLLMASNKSTGRKTTVRLAAFITGYLLMEVHPSNEDELHEILKEAVNKTRVDGVRVIILVHEGVSQPIRWELLAAMAHQTQAGLYTEDLRNVVSRATDVRKSRRYRMDYWMSEKYLSQIHRNVHVFLLLPFTTTDSSEVPANNGDRGLTTQLMKALSLSVCVDIYQPWSRLSLVEVAAQCLKTNPPITERDTSEAGLSVVMAGIHQSACQYASVLLRDQTFNPQTFLEFIAHFHHLFKHLHTQHQSRANRLAAVLSRLDVMSGEAARYKQNLVKLQEEVSEAQQRELELLSALDHQRILLEEAQESCVVEENKLYDLEEQVSHTHKQVVPVLLLGLKLLSCLNPCDLEEVRHYRDPPEGVVRIMDAVCLLFNRPPGWESAKQLLGQDNFFQELEFFERCSVTAERLQQLALMVHSPQFVPESVQGVSRACESLCLWVKAVFQCCCMQQQLELKQQMEATARHTRAKLNRLELQKNEAKQRQEEEKIQLEGVRAKLKETEKR
ncbi:dynein heavy chain domain-containing protein 1-like, partial [Gymnodraco acuticeps]|uniref:Dynein heavy chain domain-containing protein 1-like n=1 Tax=Gymnodraco acuticeps TaxID=8218 RepID=A0A6P8UZC1_GYMAC